MDRAYSLLDVKSVREDLRVIEGIASTPSPDRASDVVDPLGAKFALPMPLLWQHRHDEPIGWVEFAKPTAKGIPFKARIADPEDFESEKVKERLREAWDSVRNKLVKAVSIGFKPLEYSYIEGGGIHFKSWEWLELSAVTVPMQAEATITTVKSIDAQARNAAGVFDESEVPALPKGWQIVPNDILAQLAKRPGEGAQDDGASSSIAAEPVDKAVTGKTVHVAKLAKKAPAGAPFVIRRIHHLS